MDIALSEEQEMLQKSVRRLLETEYSFEERKKIIASNEGFSRALWAKLAELGLLGAPLSEEFGGFGGGAVTTMIVMQELGRGLVVEPYFETVVLAGGLLEAAGTDAQKQKYLPEVAQGNAIWALAWTEPTGRYELAKVTTKATKSGDDWVLEGQKNAVVGAPWADHLIVSAKGPEGVTLFIVDRKAAGVSLKPFHTVDGRRAAEVTLKDVKVPAAAVLGGVGKGVALLEDARDRAIGALTAEAVGAMTELNAATLAYTKTRKQFNVPLGNFQVLQHKMVDCFIAREEALSLMQALTISLSRSEAGVSTFASGAKARIGEAARFVAHQSIQLHGGMGMTDELNVGHYVKRITAIETTFGDQNYHLARFARGS